MTLRGIAMKCAHCKIEIGDSPLVVMADDTIRCYTCGRLKADQRTRYGRMDSYLGNPAFTHLEKTLTALQERKDLYGTD